MVKLKSIENKKLHTAEYLMISFLICLLPRLFFLKDVYPLSVTGDERLCLCRQQHGQAWIGQATQSLTDIMDMDLWHY